jgi:hypothetical protein
MHFYMHSYVDKKNYSCKKWVLQNVYEQYTACPMTHWPNRIGQHYQPCGLGVGDTCLWVI